MRMRRRGSITALGGASILDRCLRGLRGKLVYGWQNWLCGEAGEFRLREI